MTFKTISLYILLLFFLNACTAQNTPYTDKTKHTNELRLIMHEFNLIVNDNSKSELELDDERRRYAFTLAQTLEKLSCNLENIPQNELEKSIKVEDKALFAKHIQELHKNAEEIEIIAQRYELEKLESKVQEVKQICNSCHAQIRDFR